MSTYISRVFFVCLVSQCIFRFNIEFYEGVVLQPYQEFDRMKRENCLEIVHVFETITKTRLLPTKEKDTMYQNHSLRLLISDSPPNGFHIILRKFNKSFSFITKTQ